MKSRYVELSLPVDVLSRLLRERSLVASEFRCLNRDSGEASRHAIKSSLIRSGTPD
ncbi:hypothetical protein [Pseudohalioglobus sediminis]|uniref:hypothetical protein n=1 Tax=Pseudohalioglobus sediminis TaxID=2606449 RepID=UPI00165ED5AD|nr:hypothetical protein [Pseudohalioglobus sediminis]